MWALVILHIECMCSIRSGKRKRKILLPSGFQSAIIWNPEYKTGLIYVVGQGDGRASSAC
jgi:hypothetical protein